MQMLESWRTFVLQTMQLILLKRKNNERIKSQTRQGFVVGPIV